MNKKALGLLAFLFLVSASIAHADCWTSSEGMLFSGFTPEDAIAACDYNGGIYFECQANVRCNVPMPYPPYPYPVNPYPIYPGHPYPVGPGPWGPHPVPVGPGWGPHPVGPAPFGPRPGPIGPGRGHGPRLDAPTTDSSNS